MTFASKLDKETPQTLWKEQSELGARLMFTIPFGSPTDSMQGFISVLGSESVEQDFSFPVMTICVEKPTGGAIVSTVVFPDQDIYLDFIDKFHADAYSNFSRSIDPPLN
jgi:hypothetical protein